MAEIAEQQMEMAEETSADAMLDELVSALPEEGDDLSVEKMTEEGMEEEINPEPQEVATPSDEVFVDLYETIYGEPLDESEQSEEQMQDLQELVMVMPELAAALASGDIGPTEAALMIFREASNVA